MASVLALGVVWNRGVGAGGGQGAIAQPLKNAQGEILFFFRLSTLGSIITKQGFGAIFGVFSTKCFKFYLYLPITHFFWLEKAGRTAYNPPG